MNIDVNEELLIKVKYRLFTIVTTIQCISNTAFTDPDLPFDDVKVIIIANLVRICFKTFMYKNVVFFKWSTQYKRIRINLIHLKRHRN